MYLFCKKKRANSKKKPCIKNRSKISVVSDHGNHVLYLSVNIDRLVRVPVLERNNVHKIYPWQPR